jgi:hypothetical protein
VTDTFSAFYTISAALAISVAGGCYYPATSHIRPSPYIVLHGFSEANYAALDKSVGGEVCITGKLSVDSMGVYYPLQPSEEDDVIDLGFSRINTGLNRILASRMGLRNGHVHTICGLLEDATPFERCDNNRCRWYNVTAAKVQRK